MRVKGVRSTTHVGLHTWRKTERSTILAAEGAAARLTINPTVPSELPPWRMLLIWNNLMGYKMPALVVRSFRQGMLPLYTPLSES